MNTSKRIADKTRFQVLINQICSQFVRDYKKPLENKLTGIVGIQTRGVPLANRLAKILKKKYGFSVPVGSLDITLYRDDVGEIGKQPIVKETNIPFSIEGKTILLIDDVLYTGRTIRSALDALLELGRPQVIRLAVMIDRMGRELPIQPDYVGSQSIIKRTEEVKLKIKETDGEDSIWIIHKKPRGK